VLVTARTLWEVKTTPPQPQAGDRTLFVTVVGRQWWWEYTYDHFDGEALGFTTANELHVPVSTADQPRPVYLTLLSADVCHSFWVPRLAGKIDLIPGRTNHLWFRSDKPDLYLGQCAEYCGTQHANMLLRVSVDPPEKFARWLANERANEKKPEVDDPAVLEGKEVFLRQSCVNCHAVRGTAARGTYAPDLTHLMRRKTLASGMIKNTEKNLQEWVDDPQKIKPGCLMPAFGLTGRERDLVLRYLLTLR
jgi:cytochrome c oxidase subunit 2